MCSYLAQQLRMMCRLKQRCQIADYDLLVKRQVHTYLELVYGSKCEHLFHFLT